MCRPEKMRLGGAAERRMGRIRLSMLGGCHEEVAGREVEEDARAGQGLVPGSGESERRGELGCVTIVCRERPRTVGSGTGCSSRHECTRSSSATPSLRRRVGRLHDALMLVCQTACDTLAIADNFPRELFGVWLHINCSDGADH